MMTPVAILMLAGALALSWVPVPRYRIHNDEAQMQKRPRDGPAAVDPLDVADDVELFAEALHAGLPADQAAGAVAAVASTTKEVWQRATALMAVGISLDRAFDEAGDLEGFDELARMLRRQAASGVAIADGCRDLSAHLRSTASDRVTARAERAGVFIALPLTGCFLPAFIVLGLAPVVVSLGTDLLNH